MKRTTTTTTTTDARKAATERRLAMMRANLTAMENKAETILAKGDAMTAADRRELLSFVNVAYHKGYSKIEGLFSIDGSAACDFCQRMRKAAQDDILLICGKCYAAADTWKEAAWRRHKLNARILSTVLFSVDELQWLALPQRAQVRINEDGDTTNQTHGQNILRIFKAFPGCDFGYWFKNVPAVAAALKAEGITKREDRPKNARFVQSSLFIGFAARPVWFTDCVFTVYPDAETTADAVAAGAWECNGRRCRACGFHCYRPELNGGNVVFIAEVLRANKVTVAAIRAAYEARRARLENR